MNPYADQGAQLRGDMPSKAQNLGMTTSERKRGGGKGDKIPRDYRMAELQNWTPEQLDLFLQQYPHIDKNSFLARLAAGDESIFDELEAPAIRQFSELQGGISSRFSGQGTGGRHSSGHLNTQTAAASNFAQQLQADRAKLRLGATEQLLASQNRILGQKKSEKALVEKKPNYNAAESLGGPAIQAAGTVAAALL